MEQGHEDATHVTGIQRQDKQSQHGQEPGQEALQMDHRTRSNCATIETQMVAGKKPSQVLESTMADKLGSVQGSAVGSRGPIGQSC
tara:strand:+ start:2324 stop:2581 length:258 start_codon:yes stop_codon:yes gene_type:complete